MSITYMQIGMRHCIPCYEKTGHLIGISLDAEDTRALRREVRACPSCGLMSVGEKIPPQLNFFFDGLDEGENVIA